MTAITVRPVDEADRGAVESIAHLTLEALRSSPSVAQWGSAMRRTFVERWVPDPSTDDATQMRVAEVGGVVVGAGSVRPGRRHPHAFMRLAVLPDHRRNGVGTALYRALTDDNRGPFGVREMLSDSATIAFYEARGFVTGERTLEGVVDPGDAAMAVWIDDTLEKRARVRIERASRTLSDVDLAAAADRLYEWIHPWSPPRPLDADTAVMTYLRGARPDAQLTAWLHDDLVGVSLLTDSPFGAPRQTAHLGFCGVTDPKLRQAKEVTELLLAGSLRLAAKRGWRVEIEANHCNVQLWDTLHELPAPQLFSDMTWLVSRYGE